jgi:sugar phosphate isomerase/epimerase
MSTRRTFLKNSALAVAGASVLPTRALISPSKKDYLGLQLYSVREAIWKDTPGSLKKVAEMGYKYVEHAGYMNGKFYKNYDAKEFRAMLDGNGLKMCSGHTGFNTKESWDASKNDFTDSWKKLVEDAAIAGQQFVVSPWIDESYYKTYDDLVRFLELFNKCGELCKAHGMRFGYHNHWFEFNTTLNGQKMYDIILAKTDPHLVVQQLDMGNLYNGGAIAIAVIMQYPNRFELMHVKDEIPATKKESQSAGSTEKYESTILGQGIVDTKKVCDAGRKGGTQYYIVEQESYQGRDPFDDCKKDYDIMRGWGY